ncbi:hypothetical protein M514_08699 [Trichuris suis]|uniref:Uncharacterized protein n=1 Tax=Trichuris suis TaxID=68888 RepID=A0A085LZS6_9BILA|nr:hypothetical protein M513_08699 [Trichuris suis]KFD62358.1 hypothetical protein M514_08699 [Trichuris suis]
MSPRSSDKSCWYATCLSNLALAEASYRGQQEAHFVGKLSDVKLVPELDGLSQPVLERHEKLELVCELCGIADIARVFPLRLNGSALAVYLQLASEDRKNVRRIKEALIAAFALDLFAPPKSNLRRGH